MEVSDTATSLRSLRIEFRQAGGIVGGLWEASIDTKDLSPVEARELEELVEESGFFDLPSGWLLGFLRVLSNEAACDIFRYEVAISRGKRHHRISLDDQTVPPQLRPLINRLAEIARCGS